MSQCWRKDKTHQMDQRNLKNLCMKHKDMSVCHECKTRTNVLDWLKIALEAGKLVRMWNTPQKDRPSKWTQRGDKHTGHLDEIPSSENSSGDRLIRRVTVSEKEKLSKITVFISNGLVWRSDQTFFDKCHPQFTMRQSCKCLVFKCYRHQCCGRTSVVGVLCVIFGPG